jgi:hypothetical protein
MLRHGFYYTIGENGVLYRLNTLRGIQVRMENEAFRYPAQSSFRVDQDNIVDIFNGFRTEETVAYVAPHTLITGEVVPVFMRTYKLISFSKFENIRKFGYDLAFAGKPLAFFSQKEFDKEAEEVVAGRTYTKQLSHIDVRDWKFGGFLVMASRGTSWYMLVGRARAERLEVGVRAGSLKRQKSAGLYDIPGGKTYDALDPNGRLFSERPVDTATREFLEEAQFNPPTGTRKFRGSRSKICVLFDQNTFWVVNKHVIRTLETLAANFTPTATSEFTTLEVVEIRNTAINTMSFRTWEVLTGIGSMRRSKPPVLVEVQYTPLVTELPPLKERVVRVAVADEEEGDDEGNDN